MPDPINPTPIDVPVYFQALINIVAFLIAAACMWYAYFVKGKTNVQSGSDVPWFDSKVFRKMGEDLTRLADSTDKLHSLFKQQSEEAEIRRRVEDELERRKKE